MSDDELKSLFDSIKTVAIVGLSNNQQRAAYGVASYLQRAGYRIVPINPSCDEVLGEMCYPNLTDVPFPVDAVDVFRRSEFAPEIARQAVEMGAKVLWLQDGVESDEAGKIAAEGGLTFVQNDCMFRQRTRLCGYE